MMGVFCVRVDKGRISECINSFISVQSGVHLGGVAQSYCHTFHSHLPPEE